MPGRKVPLVNGEIYHVVNRGIASQPIFLNKRDYDRKIATLSYYQHAYPPLRYSFFIRLPKQRRLELIEQFKKKDDFLVEILAYCLMPNHLHLLLKQVRDNGISSFMSNISNSYTRYLNIKNDRVGPIYQGKFKAVRIVTEEQLLHVQRYIHLNPYSSHIVNNAEDLKDYHYSSFPEYLEGSTSSISNKELIMNFFTNIESYKTFIYNQADYQRKLDEIKHLILEK
ncbi:hypothetical protein A3A76_01660 [Candidatus Woesebacteria bacterium RIFCSPLOWO2_01_FULL_39_23]|uniref:Transposase IS200-like domain-containing protein n=1 Tax=Candidatus Woesebacteria bacterium RIFCSPHIGHO2_01_FULL_40_22 TaxID=1802499 RepID=A0A1F7YF42_9BACT|nr:MAG: hypothetical protein A2141_02235 [Candidatus Woesebacteria bacterium RBG_16_40_11]OGM25790.1 MAG: hypothetical protein A2628_00515 [Candidatus Woesebacteria bacterium RIFCSPHIGHO2_01_FULL_40_22]OGM36388.1 MAG: hypothetical protein A3E41_04865 [Candidatus Woesebacteria bacterium RIFCSPHIGHO2_12_FULL_38_9]OGM61742.1 MAG: hypothetical protein A3A76_01660 [Candidatus Woesebacteria bacterium RIFCSPLOWO2_01_FULL_39_23]